jgi:hypothetical protein
MDSHPIPLVAFEREPFAFSSSPSFVEKSSPPYTSECLVARLPLELLALVFEMAERSQRHSHSAGRYIPLIISHVCATWRCLACTLSSIWCDIQLTLWAPSHLCHLFLARSKTRAFELTVLPGPVRTTPPRGMLGVLISNMERCRAITVVTNNDEVIQNIISALAHMHLPILSEISVQHYDYRWAGQSPRATLSSVVTPRLAVLRVKNILWDWRTMVLDQLTTLEINVPFDAPLMAIPLGDFRTIVACTPHLRHLGLAGAPLLMDAYPSPPLCMPALQVFELDVVQSLGLSAKVCDILETPNLESLTLSHDIEGMAMAIIKRRGEDRCRYPKLTKLSLAAVSAYDLRCVDDLFVGAMPAVKHLRLLNVDIRGSMQILSRVHAVACVGGRLHWPQLDTLTLEKWPVFDMVSPHMFVTHSLALTDGEVIAIASMLCLRRGTEVPIERLRLQSSAFGHPIRVVRDLERFTSVEWFEAPECLPNEVYL